MRASFRCCDLVPTFWVASALIVALAESATGQVPSQSTEPQPQVYRQLCDGGDAAACNSLADLYRQGLAGLPKDLPQAVALYRKACDGGSVEGCHNLGNLYANGDRGLPKDLTQAAALFRRACDGGFAEGCRNLGLGYEIGAGGLPKDLAQAAALYRKACDGGFAEGCRNLGNLYANGDGGLPKDLTQAIPLWRKACDSGPGGCNNLGIHYAKGDGGLPKDLAQAAALYRKACDGGFAAGCSNLGNLYANGDGGLPKDLTQAVAFYREACDGGLAEGCRILGLHYQMGDAGLPKNLTQAVTLYRKACAGGSGESCNLLAVLYEYGEGDLPKDSAQAAALYKKACDGGVARACDTLRSLGAPLNSSGTNGVGPVVSSGSGISAPVPIYQPEPEYSQEARDANIEGTVILSLVVGQTGKAVNLQIVRGLGLGLDEKAIEAVKKWQFKPGYKDGKPVAVFARVEVNFRLLHTPQPTASIDLPRPETTTGGPPVWIKIRSKHFEIHTPASEQKAREIVNYFEGIRSFVRALLRVTTSDSKVDIIAFTSPAEFAEHRPNEGAEAYYQYRDNQDYIVLGNPAAPLSAMAHEYVHLIVRQAGLRPPPWLNEGFAEVFSAIQPAENGGTLVGGDIPLIHQFLRAQPWVSLRTILDADEKSPYYNEKGKANSLYGEGWALTHMLAFAPEYKQKFWGLLTSMRDRSRLTSEGALTGTYGKPLASIESDLVAYIRDNSFTPLHVPIDIGLGNELGPARVMKESEVKHLLANLAQPKRQK